MAAPKRDNFRLDEEVDCAEEEQPMRAKNKKRVSESKAKTYPIQSKRKLSKAVLAQAIVLGFALFAAFGVLLVQTERISSINAKKNKLVKELNLLNEQQATLDIQLSRVVDTKRIRQAAAANGLRNAFSDQIREIDFSAPVKVPDASLQETQLTWVPTLTPNHDTDQSPVFQIEDIEQNQEDNIGQTNQQQATTNQQSKAQEHTKSDQVLPAEKIKNSGAKAVSTPKPQTKSSEGKDSPVRNTKKPEAEIPDIKEEIPEEGESQGSESNGTNTEAEPDVFVEEVDTQP